MQTYMLPRELSKHLGVDIITSEITNIEYSGGHRYTCANVSIKGDTHHIADDVLAELLFCYWNRKNNNF